MANYTSADANYNMAKKVIIERDKGISILQISRDFKRSETFIRKIIAEHELSDKFFKWETAGDPFINGK